MFRGTVARNFSCSPFRQINPLLPFDVLGEVDNDELAETNEKLKKEKSKLKKQTQKLKERVQKNEDPNKDGNENEDEQQSKSANPLNEKPTASQHTSDFKAKSDPGAPETINAEIFNITQHSNVAFNEGGSGNGDDGKKQAPEEEHHEEDAKEEKSKIKEALDKLAKFLFKSIETMALTFSSVAILGVTGFLYHKFYRDHVLNKLDEAFDKGDPAFQLTMHNRTKSSLEDWVERPQQALLDDIMNGNIVGRYFLVIGEKGTGKTSIILEAMKKVEGYNCAFFDAHADPEIFRIRLGRALKFEYHEDYIGSLFSIRGPRDTTALLDIERAFNKLEEVAVARVRRTKKPLVLVINNAHLIRDDEEGRDLVELLQQKAEALSGSGLVTMIFNSDDYWLYERLKKLGTRLEVINVRDLDRGETKRALKYARNRFFDEDLNDDLANKIYDLIGGRPQHISQVTKHRDIITAAHEVIDREKTWLLNQCGLLGMDMDDDVMESGKFATSAMLLMKAFVDMDRERLDMLDPEELEKENHVLPEMPLWRARQIMTRNDYIEVYDNLNIFTIDSHSKVRADSIPMMRAFHEIASQPGFEALLAETVQRVADIESLGRTREVVAKDLVLGGKYKVKSKENGNYRFELEMPLEIDDNDDIMLEDISKNANKKWWSKRMKTFRESYHAEKAKNDPGYDLDLNRENRK